MRCAHVLLAITLAAAASSTSAQTARAGDPQRPLAVIAPTGLQPPPPQIDVPRRADAGAGRRDLFAPHSWAPPAPIVPKTKPKPPPELHGPPAPPPPPPLALTYLGQLDVEGSATVFYLAQGDRVHAVSLGDTIDGVYRVLGVEGRQLALLHVPLDVKQLLSLGPPR